MLFIYLKTCFQITSDYIPIYNRFRSWAFHTFVEKGLGRLHIYIYRYAQSRITWQHIIETESTWKDGKGAHVLNKSTLLRVIVVDFWFINMMEKLFILLLKVKIQNVGLKFIHSFNNKLKLNCKSNSSCRWSSCHKTDISTINHEIHLGVWNIRWPYFEYSKY